jgi:putative transposase
MSRLPVRKNTRLPGFNYAEPGWYFITICTFAKQSLFGDVRYGTMRLNDLGATVSSSWLRIPQLRPYIRISEFVVMPNHFHALICILGETDIQVWSERRIRITQSTTIRPFSLSSVVGGFKSEVSRRSGHRSIWQRNYHDRVIRNSDELRAAANYIRENPIKWGCDSLNPGAIKVDVRKAFAVWDLWHAR